MRDRERKKTRDDGRSETKARADNNALSALLNVYYMLVHTQIAAADIPIPAHRLLQSETPWRADTYEGIRAIAVAARRFASPRRRSDRPRAQIVKCPNEFSPTFAPSA